MLTFRESRDPFSLDIFRTSIQGSKERLVWCGSIKWNPDSLLKEEPRVVLYESSYFNMNELQQLIDKLKEVMK